MRCGSDTSGSGCRCRAPGSIVSTNHQPSNSSAGTSYSDGCLGAVYAPSFIHSFDQFKESHLRSPFSLHRTIRTALLPAFRRCEFSPTEICRLVQSTVPFISRIGAFSSVRDDYSLVVSPCNFVSSSLPGPDGDLSRQSGSGVGLLRGRSFADEVSTSGWLRGGGTISEPSCDGSTTGQVPIVLSDSDEVCLAKDDVDLTPGRCHCRCCVQYLRDLADIDPARLAPAAATGIAAKVFRVAKGTRRVKRAKVTSSTKSYSAAVAGTKRPPSTSICYPSDLPIFSSVLVSGTSISGQVVHGDSGIVVGVDSSIFPVQVQFQNGKRRWFPLFAVYLQGPLCPPPATAPFKASRTTAKSSASATVPSRLFYCGHAYLAIALTPEAGGFLPSQ